MDGYASAAEKLRALLDRRFRRPSRIGRHLSQALSDLLDDRIADIDALWAIDDDDLAAQARCLLAALRIRQADPQLNTLSLLEPLLQPVIKRLDQHQAEISQLTRRVQHAERILARLDDLGIRGPVDRIRVYAEAKQLAQCCAHSQKRGERDWRWRAEKFGLDPNDSGIRVRSMDPYYWRRQLRWIIRGCEVAWIILAPESLAYVSPDALRLSREIDETAQWQAENCEFGQQGDPDTSISAAGLAPAEAAKRRYAELNARTVGISQLAAEEDRTLAILITLTCPSHMHPTTTAGGGERRPNPNYDGVTLPNIAPSAAWKTSGALEKSAAGWFQGQWKRLRSAAKRRGVLKYWVLGVQPHKDQTPHWHLVAWVTSAEVVVVEELLRRYYQPESGHQIDIEVLGDAQKGMKHAINYTIRGVGYAARGIGGRGEDDTDEANDAARITAYTRAWGLRRIRTSHSKATVWRYLRRKDMPAMPGTAAEAAQAARDGDFAAFIRASGGLKPALIDARNRYGEPVRRVVGVRDLESNAVYVPKTRWVLRRRRSQAAVPQPDACTVQTRERSGRSVQLGKYAKEAPPIGRFQGGPGPIAPFGATGPPIQIAPAIGRHPSSSDFSGRRAQSGSR